MLFQPTILTFALMLYSVASVCRLSSASASSAMPSVKLCIVAKRTISRKQLVMLYIATIANY